MSLSSSRREFLQKLSLATGALFSAPLLTASGEEAPAAPAGVRPIQYGPYLQNPSDTEMSVLWTTEHPGLSWVEYWPANEPEKKKIAQDSAFGLRRFKTREHSVTLRGLKPGTSYTYKVHSREKNPGADVIESSGGTEQDGSFKTLDPNAPTSRIFIVNDMHGRGEYMNDLFQKGKADQSDLIFHNGDIVDWISSENQIREKVILPAKEYLSKVPFVFVRGNHEYRGGHALSVDKTFPPRDGRYYYLLRQGPICFLVMDTGEDKADDRKELGGVTDWTSYFDEQAEWLKTALDNPLFKDAPYRVVLQHIPVWKTGSEDFTTALIKEKFHPAMSKGNANLLIGAHTHRNALVEPSAETKASFPILINDNKGYLTIQAGKEEMVVEQFDKDGQKLREMKFNPKQG